MGNEKRKVSITIEIDDCKDCPHYVMLEASEERRIAERHVCGVTDQILEGRDEGFGTMYPELLIPDHCPLLELQKMEKDDCGREYWKEMFCEDGCEPEITWEEFQDSYFKCPECGAWVNEQCLCYTR